MIYSNLFMKMNTFLKFRFANFSASFELSHGKCVLCFKTVTVNLSAELFCHKTERNC